MVTLSPREALNFAVIQERDAFMNRRISERFPGFGKNKFNDNRPKKSDSKNSGHGGSNVK